MPYLLAHLNLGTMAFLERDFERAERHYDLAQPENIRITSDIFLHAFRAETYRTVGRLDDALIDARQALEFLDRGVLRPDGPALNNDMRIGVLEMILQTLHEAEAPELAWALTGYLALPVVEGFELANRAAVLTELGYYDYAISYSEQALRAAPDEAGLQNNHCYLLALMGRGEEAAPFCERAIAADPDEPIFRHSMAMALSVSGRCEEGVAQRLMALEMQPIVAIYSQPLPCETAAEGAP